jgi:uncharacterized protein
MAITTGTTSTRRTWIGLFLVGTFGWAWLFWGYWVVAMPAGGLQISPAFIACALIGGLAPSLTAIAISRAGGGSRQVIELLSSTWRKPVTGAPLVVALLLAPATVVLSVLIQQSTIGALKWPDPALLVMALVWPALAALGEEFGWRGFLLPRLEAKYGLLAAALIIGVVWGVWHLPPDYIALKGYGDWFWAAFLVNGPMALTAHSIIMAWLWRRTDGSMLAVLLYHFSVTASAMVAPTSGVEGVNGVVTAAIGATLLWVAALLLLWLRRSDFR